jgi:hypothetical protein
MKATFLHPRTSEAFTADVEPNTTGKTCVDELIKANFIQPPPEGRPYGLLVTRTNKQMLSSMTMEQAGVGPDEIIAIIQMEQGARH